MFTSATSTAAQRARRVPQQQRSREKRRRILDAADELLAREGSQGLATTKVAQRAGVAVGSVYAYFSGKEAIAEAVALRHWTDFAKRVEEVAERTEAAPVEDPIAAVLDALVDAFRGRPAFRALWYGGLRTEGVREVTRPVRRDVGASLERVLAVHWPGSSAADRAVAAATLVLVGDGLLREAFRLSPEGDATVLAEGRLVLGAYATAKLGERAA